MPQSSKHRKILLVLGLVPIVSIGAYFWCSLQGSCTGQCIAVGYSVGSVCMVTALKTFIALLVAILFGWLLIERVR